MFTWLTCHDKRWPKTGFQWPVFENERIHGGTFFDKFVSTPAGVRAPFIFHLLNILLPYLFSDF